MALRAYWKGYLKLSLVSCSVALFAATSSSERVRFNMLNRATGNRLKQQYVDAVTGELVAADERVRGYAVEKEEYVTVENEELEAVQLESTHTINVDKFVDRSEVDSIYQDNPYYLAPNDRVAVEAFAVIRDAMKESGTVGLARVVLHNRERVLMIEPRGKGLLATGLRYAYEVRADSSVFDDIPDVTADEETIRLAQHIIDTKRGAFDPAEFEDRYENAVVEMLKAKQAGRPAPKQHAAERPSNVVSLMDALRRSLEAEGGAAPKRAKAPPPKAKPPAPDTPPSKGARGKGAPAKPAARRVRKAG
jgi:DNA end-binding protein Ku